MSDLITFRRRLYEAETALHRLMTGEREVNVVIGGYGETKFSEVNRKDLERYIARVKNDIAVLEGRPRRRPLLIQF